MEERRKNPQDDLITGLVHAEIEEDGGTRTLTLAEILGFVQLISSAGTETVARLLGFAAVTLAQYPEQRQLLIDEPALIPNAIEELLRFEAPSPIQSRWVSRDVELHGTVVPRGSRMSLLNGSGDRDERHFENPDVFDVRRVIDRHLAFGYGTHFCTGAALARLEGKVGADRDLATVPDVGRRREPARARAHLDRARLHHGADAGRLSGRTVASPHLRPERPAGGRRRDAVPRRVRRAGDPHRGSGAPGLVGHRARRAARSSTTAAASTWAAGSTTTTSRSSGSRSTSAPSGASSCCASSCAISDVVTENFAAGVLARMGFPWEELQAIKPDIVYVSNCGFGATGPELRVQDVGPDRAGGVRSHLQLRAGRRAARGLGLLLHGPHGRRTRWRWRSSPGSSIATAPVEGQWIDMSCTEAGTTLVGPDLLDYTVNGRPLRRPGQPDSNRSHAPARAPHGIYPAAGDDNWIAIACRDDADWQQLVGGDRRAVGDRRAQRHPRRTAGRTGRARRAARGVDRDARSVHDRGGVAGRRGAGRRRSRAPRIGSTTTRPRASGVCGRRVHHREMGDVRVDGIPVHLSETDWSIERGGPCLGEHTHHVLSEILGLDDDEIEQLAKDGVT